MAFQNLKLGAALGWKHNHMPGMETSDGVLTRWPSELWPTDAELAQWVAEYEALPSDHEAKDRKAARLKKFQVVPNTIPGIRQFIEEDILPYIR